MTLLPLLLTGVCDGSTDAASALLPSLMSHLIYGGHGVCVPFVGAALHEMAAFGSANRRPRSEKSAPGGHCDTTLFALALGVLLPILLG